MVLLITCSSPSFSAAAAAAAVSKMYSSDEDTTDDSRPLLRLPHSSSSSKSSKYSKASSSSAAPDLQNKSRCDRLRKVEEWVCSQRKKNNRVKTDNHKFLISPQQPDHTPNLIDLFSPPPPPQVAPVNRHHHHRTLLLSRSSSNNLLLHKHSHQPPPQQQQQSSSRGEVFECGWFWGASASMEEIHLLLSTHPVGTFLLRTSSHPSFKYSLSVSTSRGPTSVRIVHSSSHNYSLDAADSNLPLPRFPSVIALVQYYVNLYSSSSSSSSHNNTNKTKQTQVWVESGSGRPHSRVELAKPLLTNPHSLKHLARLAINKSQVNNCARAILPTSLTKYLNNYPHTI